MRRAILAVVTASTWTTALAEQTSPSAEETLEEIKVVARVANEKPAAIAPAPISSLRFDPQLDVQSRGLAENQGDVTIRGGVFENVGFKIGAATLLDPQTGHYSVELPFDQDILSTPLVLTGIDHAQAGFNAALATVAYDLLPIAAARHVSAAVGTDNFSLGRFSLAKQLGNEQSPVFGRVSITHSEGDGSVTFGDHQITRVSAQIQQQNAASQTDWILSWQDKFYGWPGAYTGFASLPETDHTKLGLLLVNHQTQQSDTHQQQWTAYFRTLEDDYDFDRRTQESNSAGSFDHRTNSYGVALEGVIDQGTWDWHYNTQLSGDRLVRSTDLSGGDFSSRRYLRASVVPGRSWQGERGVWRLRTGLAVDWSDRDDVEWLPQLELAFETGVTEPTSTRYSLGYSSSSQLPGYTALKSRPSGLFGGNPNLGRERADTLAATVARHHANRQWSVTAFARRDRNLVDWTYNSLAPFSRQANAVDIDVTGLELIARYQLPRTRLSAGYTLIEKDEDFADMDIDASYYALNYARHRLTVAAIHQLSDTLDLRFDGAARRQQSNVLRNSDDDAIHVSASLNWRPTQWPGLSLAVIADNLTDDDFEAFPGTPAAGRGGSIQAGWDW